MDMDWMDNDDEMKEQADADTDAKLDMLLKICDEAEIIPPIDPKVQKLCERVIACFCSDIHLISCERSFQSNYVFKTPNLEPVMFVAICGKLKTVKEAGEFIWFEVEDKTGAVWCRTETLKDTVDEEFAIFAKTYKEMAKDENRDEVAWEEMQLVRDMKLGSLRAREKYTSIQKKNFKWFDDKFPYLIVHGKLAKKKKNMFLFVKKVWMPKPKEVKEFNQMVLTVKYHQNDAGENDPTQSV